GVIRKPHWYPRLGYHFSRHASGLPGDEASVIADENAASRVFMFQHIRRDSPRHASDIVKSEVVGNDAAPAVGAEFDHRAVFSRRSLVVRKSTLLLRTDNCLSYQITHFLRIQIFHNFS